MELNSEGMFETEISGEHRRIVVHAKSRDRRFQAFWRCGINELRTESKNELQLPLVHANEFCIRLMKDGKPVAGATVVLEGFCRDSATSDANGIAVLLLPEGDRPMQLIAYRESDRLAKIKWDMPIDTNEYDPLDIELDSWDLRQLQVVDTEEKPLAGIRISAGPISDVAENHPNALPAFSGRSDVNGMTSPIWIPKKSEHLVQVLTPDHRIVSIDVDANNRVVVAKMTPNVTVTGKLNLPEGVPSGLLIDGISFQSEIPNHLSSTRGRINADGSFQISVHPDFAYNLFVDDSEWLSTNWAGVLATSDGSTPAKLELEFTQGEEVEVMLMVGPDLTPAPNVFVQLESPKTFEYLDQGKRKMGGGGRRWVGRTNEDGVVTTRALPGELRVYVNDPPWREDYTTSVLEGVPKVVTFHRELKREIPFEGKLRADISLTKQPDWETIDLILLTSEDYLHQQKIPVDKHGVFHGKTKYDKIALVAATADKKWKGFVVAQIGAEQDGLLEITLSETCSLQGRALDADGFGLESLLVEIDPRASIPWKNPARKGNFFDLRNVMVRTDAEGRYAGDHIISGAPISSFMSLHDHEFAAETLLYQYSMEPGTKRTLPTVVHGIETSNAATPLGIRLDRRLNSARLMNTNVLIVLHGPDLPALEMARRLVQRRNDPLMQHLLPLVISANVISKDPAKSAWLERKGWSMPKKGNVFVAVLGRDGQVVMQREISAEESFTTLSELLDARKLDVSKDDWDAPRKLQRALEQARETKREVWVSILDHNDGTAITLRRWQTTNQATIEKSFVILSLDAIRDDGISDVLARFAKAPADKPINFVLDADGNVIWEPSDQKNEVLKYSCIDRFVLEPLLQAAKQQPFASEAMEILLKHL